MAKLGTKKMRSKFLKRIQKQKQKVSAKSRNFGGKTFCTAETTAETFSEILLKPLHEQRLRSPSIYQRADAYRDGC